MSYKCQLEYLVDNIWVPTIKIMFFLNNIMRV